MASTWPVWLSMATSAPSSSGVCSSVTVAVVPSTFVSSTSIRSPTLNRSAGDVRRVHCDAGLVSSPCSAPIRSCALVAFTDAHDGGTMSPAAMRRAQRSCLKLSTVRPSAMTLRRGLRKPASLVDAAQAAVDGVVGGLLQPQVERGAHRQPAFVQRLGAVAGFEVLAHFFEEVRRRAGLGRSASPSTTIGFCLACSAAVGGDEAFVGHAIERVVAAAAGRLRIHERALPDVALDDAGDGRRLFERQLLGRLAEVQLRRRLHAVGAVAEVDLVAIHREDLGLRVALLDLDGDERLLDLALPRAVAGREADVGGEQVARQLLGERAAARARGRSTRCRAPGPASCARC